MDTAYRTDAKEPLKYDEADLKAVVLRELVRVNKLDRRSSISSEFTLGTERRADLAVFNGTEFIGIEVKSDFDTLKRLEGQHLAYSKVFDRIIIVVADRHAPRILDDQCGNADIWSVSPFGEVKLVRVAREQPTLCKQALAALLPKAELAKLIGAERKLRVARASLNSRIDDIGIDSIRDAVVQSFTRRFEITSRRFFKGVSGGEIEPHHLARLSRFEQQRKAIQAHKRKNEKFWKEWAKVADEVFSAAT
jgi:hypothetical protein